MLNASQQPQKKKSKVLRIMNQNSSILYSEDRQSEPNRESLVRGTVFEGADVNIAPGTSKFKTLGVQNNNSGHMRKVSAQQAQRKTHAHQISFLSNKLDQSLGKLALLDKSEEMQVFERGEIGGAVSVASKRQEEQQRRQTINSPVRMMKQFLRQSENESRRERFRARGSTFGRSKTNSMAAPANPVEYYIYQKQRYLEKYNDAVQQAELGIRDEKKSCCAYRIARCAKKCRKYGCMKQKNANEPDRQPQFLKDIKKPKLDTLPPNDKSKLMRYFWVSSIKKVKGIMNVMRALRLINHQIYTYGAFHFHQNQEQDENNKKRRKKKQCVSWNNRLGYHANQQVQNVLATADWLAACLHCDIRAYSNRLYREGVSRPAYLRISG